MESGSSKVPAKARCKVQGLEVPGWFGSKVPEVPVKSAAGQV